jgi:hypothetical protein
MISRGYSLGARTTCADARRTVRVPRRAVLCGMGLDGAGPYAGAGRLFQANVLTNLGSFERGTFEWMTEAFLKTTKGDPKALLLILDTFVDTSRESEIAAIAHLPRLVVTGAEDFDNGSAEALAELLATRPLCRDTRQSYERGDPARTRGSDRGLPLQLSGWAP